MDHAFGSLEGERAPHERCCLEGVPACLPHSKESESFSSASSLNALPDAHFHLGFVADAASFAHAVCEADGMVFAASVTTGEYRQTKASLGNAPYRGVKLAVGLHPWWAPKGEDELSQELAAFDAALPQTRFVGEVGLDFSKRRVGTQVAQLQAFEHIAHACAEAGDKVLSVHCVSAYEDALRILETTGCFEACTCIFHWFSGSFPQLTKAMEQGCFFSVGERMLASKKGREYARALPLRRILLETDAPAVRSPETVHPHVEYAFESMQRELYGALGQIAELRRMESAVLAQQIRENALRVLA